MLLLVKRWYAVISKQVRKDPNLWFVAVLMLAVPPVAFAFMQFELSVSQPGVDGNAKIVWGQMCKGGQCQNAALLNGLIPPRTELLINELEKNPGVRVICLNSQGGNIKGANKLASWIAEHEYETCLPHFDTKDKIAAHCVSSCTRIFIAGQKRNMTPTALFQIHTGALPFVQSLNGFPEEDSPSAKTPSKLVQLLEPLNHELTRFINFKDSPFETPSLLEKKLQDEALKIPSYRLRTVPAEELVQWGALDKLPNQDILFKTN